MAAKLRGSKARPEPRLREGNLAQLAADQLRERILSGELKVGQPLRERELSAALGISRIPLREALHRLASEGLVSLRPNRGAVVADISRAELLEIGEACQLLECHLLALALPRLSVKILDEAEACLDHLDGLADPSEWARTNWRFHTTLYRAAERPFLNELLNSLRARAERAMLILVADSARRAVLNREHRAILDCARKKRPARARSLLDAHLEGGKQAALRLIGGG